MLLGSLEPYAAIGITILMVTLLAGGVVGSSVFAMGAFGGTIVRGRRLTLLASWR